LQQTFFSIRISFMSEEQKRAAHRPHGTKERVQSDGLKRLRAARDWSQFELAVQLGCSLGTVTACEQAEELPTNRKGVLDKVIALAKESGVELP
jgi:DNA-binding transcriptional regulator YiaG